jgi:DNA-binding transcriptional LysR family regulator
MRMPSLDLDLLQAFVAVAEQRSFTRAAVHLHRTQPAVSMQVQRLEARVGTRLLRRTKTKVELTPAGERLLDDARRMLALNDQAVHRVRGERPEGLVRLGVMQDYGTHLLPATLARFIAAHPLIEVELKTGLTASMPARLGHDLDLAIVMHRQGEGDGDLLWREQAVWAAPPTPNVEHAERLPVALYPQGCLFRQWASEALDTAGRAWRLAFVSESLPAVEAIVAEGLAVTVVKHRTFPSQLRRVSQAEGMPPLPPADIRLHRGKGISKAAAMLADHLTHFVGSPHAMTAL